MNKATHKSAAMMQMNHDRFSENRTHTRSHQCDDAQGEGQIQLACGCMLPVVAGALSPNGEKILKQWKSEIANDTML